MSSCIGAEFKTVLLKGINKIEVVLLLLQKLMGLKNSFWKGLKMLKINKFYVC